MSRPLRVYYFPTPNGRKVSIALEEMGLAYEIAPVNILQGEQQRPEFLQISPNNRIPALVDWTADGKPIRIFESGAILQYLGRKSGLLYPREESARCWVDAWLFWQMAGLGPMAGQLSWFIRVSNIPDRDGRDYDYAIHRYRKEVRRLYGVLERQLAGRSYICDDYSIADIASWTWIDQYNDHVGGLAEFPNIAAWHARLAERAAVKRGMTVWMPESDGGWSAAGDAAQIAKGAKVTKELDIQAYIAISEVKARYCRTLDTKDWAGFADVFTEDFDCDGTAAGGWHIKGREAVVSAIRASIEHAQTAHQVHSPQMKIDGDVADVVWAMQDRVIWGPERRPRPEMGGHTGFGHYHERYVRKEGKWRIASQRLTRLIVEYHPPKSNG